MDEDLLNRQLPHSLEAEQAVLGAMLVDSRCVPEVIGLLKVDDFYLRQNRELYECIYSMFSASKEIDPVTVLEAMREMGYYQENTRDYVVQLLDVTPTAENAKRYAGIVRDKALLRELAQACTEINDSVYAQVGTVPEIIENAEKKIFALRKGEHGDSLERIGTIMYKVFDRLNELLLSDSAIPGLSTGLRDVDTKINGLNKGNLIIVAARPAMGKTSFALNIGYNVAKKYDKTVAIFSLEMSREELAMRLLSSTASVDSSKLSTGKLDDDEWERLCSASTALSQTDIRVDDNSGITVAQMLAKLRRLDNLGLVIIDYLQLMSGPSGSGDNRVQVVSEISRSLKIMAKELQVPVICLSQLSRGPESRTDKRPLMSDLRESGSIEQDADAVLFLYRDDYYNKETEEQNISECIVSKNRHGEVGTVKLQWMPQFTTFTDLEWKHDT